MYYKYIRDLNYIHYCWIMRGALKGRFTFIQNFKDNEFIGHLSYKVFNLYYFLKSC